MANLLDIVTIIDDCGEHSLKCCSAVKGLSLSQNFDTSFNQTFIAYKRSLIGV